MIKRDIIVMGASAGGIEAYCEILRGLPSDLAASVFVVQHAGSTSVPADVRGRRAAFQLATAANGEGVRQGRAYVAPGNRHLLLDRGRVRVSRAARENNQRPSVDALFRSAAKAYRSRVIAVVLSGMLDDGAAGACAVKERGGVVIVQDPRTALYSPMPENALRAVQADYCVPLAEIAGLLVKLVREDTTLPALTAVEG